MPVCPAIGRTSRSSSPRWAGRLDDVRAIVLTHGDTDHIGFAERLRRERGIPVFVHGLDANRARGEVKQADPPAGVR